VQSVQQGVVKRGRREFRYCGFRNLVHSVMSRVAGEDLYIRIREGA
jgi:hypothetical protein